MFFFFSSRRRHTIFKCDWSSDVCSSDLNKKAIRRLDGADYFSGDADLQGFSKRPSQNDSHGPIEGPQKLGWPLADLGGIPGALEPRARSQGDKKGSVKKKARNVGETWTGPGTWKQRISYGHL